MTANVPPPREFPRQLRKYCSLCVRLKGDQRLYKRSKEQSHDTLTMCVSLAHNSENSSRLSWWMFSLIYWSGAYSLSACLEFSCIGHPSRVETLFFWKILELCTCVLNALTVELFLWLCNFAWYIFCCSTLFGSSELLNSRLGSFFILEIFSKNATNWGNLGYGSSFLSLWLVASVTHFSWM